MKRTIDQFMWGYQQHFRLSAQHGVEAAFEAIGARFEVRVVLIGFSASDASRHDICVEPETGPLTQSHFAGVMERAAEIFSVDPETEIRHSLRSFDDKRRSGLFLRARSRAIAEAVEQSGALPDMRAFVSLSTPIGGYDVHSVVAVEAGRFEGLVALEGEYFDRIYVGESLQHEVIAECLRRADRALHVPDPGAGLLVLGATTDEILRAAASTFTRGCVVRTGEFIAGEPFVALNRITALSYERMQAEGRIVFVDPQSPSVTVRQALARPIPLSNARSVRKLLEATGGSVSLLAYGTDVYGLGDVGDYSSSGVVAISIPQHATWELAVNDSAMMRVTYGEPTLPRPILDRRAFEETVRRAVGDADTDRLWTYADTAAAAGHGSIQVIADAASAEAERLASHSTLIEPTVLDSEDVARLSRIDGALLFDPNGVCHAVGAILDGVAAGKGDPSRGARYNSALRYQQSAPSERVVVVVVSDDGMVDLVPNLRPRVSRDAVQTAVDDLRIVCSDDEPEGEAFVRAYDRVKRYAFYLDADQCDEVNRLYRAEQERRLASGGMAIRERDIFPDPDMDDSYFI